MFGIELQQIENIGYKINLYITFVIKACKKSKLKKALHIFLDKFRIQLQRIENVG